MGKALMDHDELRRAAYRLYGERKPANQYHRLLAADLMMSPAGIAKYWYAAQPIPGPTAVAVRLLLWRHQHLGRVA